jgi:hypothetical protein
MHWTTIVGKHTDWTTIVAKHTDWWTTIVAKHMDWNDHCRRPITLLVTQLALE